jgi:hypothetical protein
MASTVVSMRLALVEGESEERVEGRCQILRLMN